MTARRLPLLEVHAAGADTIIGAGLCATCPHSAAGCCVAPPRMDWSDLARVVHHGGAAWLVEQLAAKNLVPCARGLSLRRVKGVAGEGGPRIAKCVFHASDRGCTIAHVRRPATCNYYVCESVLDDAAAGGERSVADGARAVQAELVDAFVRWDEELDREVRATYPDGAPFDEPFLVWIHARWAARN